MAKKKLKKQKRPACLSWEFDPDIPLDDFFEGKPLTDSWNLQQAVEGFVLWMEEDRFLTWEGIMRKEQGLRLTARQKELVGDLLNFSDDELEDRILYIDEIPRPSEPWYVILTKIVPHLLIEPYRTWDMHEEVQCDGWNQMMSALNEHGEGLSLPQGAKSPEEVVPAALRHKLWLQYCFNDLDGLGQAKELTLEDPEEHYRIEWFVENLRECKESVKFFGLTLESLLTKVILPDKERPIFVKMMKERPGIHSGQERLAKHL